MMRGSYRKAVIAAVGLASVVGSDVAWAEYAGPRGGNQFMKQCSAAGESFYGGFHYVPGTDTCISLGGYLWAEGYWNTYTQFPATNSKYYTIGTYGFQLNSWTNTEYGALRSYIDIRYQIRSAEWWGFQMDGNETQANPWAMYVQFDGFTAGYLQSMFDFYANANVYGTDPATIGDQQQIPLLAYTWEMGSGWKLTFSLEDAHQRNEGVDPANAGSKIAYSTKSMNPDIIGAIGQSGDWGAFQFSGAMHRVGASQVISSGKAGDDYVNSKGSFWGYAVQAGLMFNLPQIAEGDSLYLQTAYVDGAVSYLGIINPTGDFAMPDAYLNADGSFSKVSGWNMTFQYLHNFNSVWNSAIFGGYAQFDINNMEAEKTIGASGGANYNIGGNIVWQPKPAFNVTLQYQYNVYEAKNYRHTGYGLPVSSQSASEILLMTQRLF